jgi:hypothetical protein
VPLVHASITQPLIDGGEGGSETLQLAPVPASNGVSDPRRMLAYARTHGGPDVTVAAGTKPFTGSIIG